MIVIPAQLFCAEDERALRIKTERAEPVGDLDAAFLRAQIRAGANGDALFGVAEKPTDDIAPGDIIHGARLELLLLRRGKLVPAEALRVEGDGAGKDIDEAFGLVETVEKAAQLYMLTAHLPIVNEISDDQLRELAAAFGLTYREDFMQDNK